MWIRTEMLIGIAETNKNIYSAFEIADEVGCAVVLKNNKPEYFIFPMNNFISTEKMPTMKIRDAKMNFTTLTNLLYNAGKVCITKRGKPAYSIFDRGTIISKDYDKLIFILGRRKEEC